MGQERTHDIFRSESMGGSREEVLPTELIQSVGVVLVNGHKDSEWQAQSKEKWKTSSRVREKTELDAT